VTEEMSMKAIQPAWAPVLIAATAMIALADLPSLRAQAGTSSKGGTASDASRFGLVWPAPPEQPRIRYLATYHGVDDFKTKKPSKWKAMILGPDDATLRPSDTMVKPYGISVTPDGRVLVTDTAARRVFQFDLDAKTVSFVGESGTGKITKPIGVAVDGEGKVFVADATLNRVFGYARDGSLAVAIGHEGELESPSGLAADRQHNWIYVADSKKHQVFCYSSVDGSHVRTIGTRGEEPGSFNFPTNLFVDRQGRLYVADTLNFRIQIFDASGTFVRAFGTLGDIPGTLNRPKGIGVDSEGHIYVVDTAFNNFQIFDGDGRLLLAVGNPGRNPGEFLLPAGLYIDSRDRIYVADQGNARVQVFQYLRAGR
jgi:DNA-binding beta-propeller fold protein YncE